MQKKIQNSKFGFTLIELLVSVFIIAAITGIFLTNYHSTNKRSQLINVVQEVAGNIKLAQSYSLGLRDYDGNVPAGPWGVYFDITAPNSYIIHINSNSPLSYYDSGDEVVEVIDLPEGISIDSIVGGDAGDSENTTIVFWAPYSATSIDCRTIVDYMVDISFKESAGGTVKTIQVNFLGLVDVID